MKKSYLLIFVLLITSASYGADDYFEKPKIQIAKSYCNSEAVLSDWYKRSGQEKQLVTDITGEFNEEFHHVINYIDGLSVNENYVEVVNNIGTKTIYERPTGRLKHFVWLISGNNHKLEIDIKFWGDCLSSVTIASRENNIGYHKRTKFTSTPPGS
jgi:hypothetical protein